MVITEWTVLTVMIPISFGTAVGVFSKSIYLGLGAATVILGYLAVQTRDPFAVGLWFLILLLMALASGKKMADMLLGEVA